MIETTIRIEGMMCGMCEAHINDALRKIPGVSKASSSHGKGVSKIVSKEEISQDVIKHAIEEAGYTFLSASSAPAKKRLFGLF